MRTNGFDHRNCQKRRCHRDKESGCCAADRCFWPARAGEVRRVRGGGRDLDVLHDTRDERAFTASRGSARSLAMHAKRLLFGPPSHCLRASLPACMRTTISACLSPAEAVFNDRECSCCLANGLNSFVHMHRLSQGPPCMAVTCTHSQSPPPAI